MSESNFGTILLETQAQKKGMSITGNWTDRYLRLYDSKDGLVLAYFKNKDDGKPKGSLKIKPNGKIHELDHGKRPNLLKIAALDGRTFLCQMPDLETRTKWAQVLREETDNVIIKGRPISQSTTKMTKEKIQKLEIKVVSRMRLRNQPPASNTKQHRRNKSTRQFLNEKQFSFDFGAFNFALGKWYKLWTKSLSGKDWKQVFNKTKSDGLIKMFGTQSSALKWSETSDAKTNAEKVRERALDIELWLHSLLNMVDTNAVRANAAPWVCITAFPQLHRTLGIPLRVAEKFCQIGYARKCLAFGEDPQPERTGVEGDFDIDEETEDFRLSVAKPDAPKRADAATAKSGIREPRGSKKWNHERSPSKLTFKPVVVYSGPLWKRPTSGGFGRGRKRWFSLRRNECGRTAMLEYFEGIDEKRLKGSVILNSGCSLEMGTSYCMSGRWRFCLKSGVKTIEAEAGSEKEFGCWAMHILRYTNPQNRLSTVSPRPSVFDDDDDDASASGSALAAGAASPRPKGPPASSAPTNGLPPRVPEAKVRDPTINVRLLTPHETPPATPSEARAAAANADAADDPASYA